MSIWTACHSLVQTRARHFVASPRALLLLVSSSAAAVANRSGSPSSSLLPPAVVAETARAMSDFKIYTKTGDDGTSSLYTGERRDKNDIIFDALGDVDEVNSNLGACREQCLRSANAQLSGLNDQIAMIQSRLLDVGSAVATPLNSSSKWKVTRVEFSPEYVTQLENWIDEMNEQLPKLTNFILPSGGLAASHLHVTRTVCRRAERKVVPLVKQKLVSDAVGKYMNRLSDYLFIAARFAAKKEGYEEVVYKKA